MPKKKGINSKAVEALERKAAIKKATQDKAAKEAEDRLWEDDDKTLVRKQQKREDEERKKAEIAKRKAEAKALLDMEMNSIKTQGKQPLAKINRQQILEEMEKKQKAIDAINAANKPLPSRVIIQNDVIEENLNVILADVEVATGVDQAIAVLSVKEVDHPAERMRSAFKAFEASNLPRIKSENPHLRLSQWKQMLMKEWNKAPDNPFNQSR